MNSAQNSQITTGHNSQAHHSGISQMTDQLKGLSLAGQSVSYSSVPASQITAGNKENNKKTPNDTITNASGPKMTLKAREFGREITNATSQSTNSGSLSSKQTHQTSQIVLDNAYQPNIGVSGQNISLISGVNGSFSSHATAQTKRNDPNAYPARLTANSRFSSQRNVNMPSGQVQQQKSSINTSILAQNNLLKKAKTNVSVPHVNNNQSTVESSVESNSGPSSQSKSDKSEKEDSLIKLQVIPVLGAITTVPETAEQVKEKCRQRIDDYKKAIKKNMPLSDQLDMRDPQCIAEFAQEVYQSMLDKEPEYYIDHEYLKKVQSEVKDTSRGFLVEWIIDVHRKFRLMSETLYVTISIIDRYLSKVAIKKSQLHLLGVTALLIATKYEEIYPPDLKDLLSVSENKFSKEEVLKMEYIIIQTLEFNFFAPSALRFLERFRKISNTASDDQIFYFAQYLAEIALLDAFLLKHKQSHLAAAAFILSAKSIKKINAWNNEMEKVTGIKEKDVKEAVDDLKQFALEVNPKFLSTLKYKFQKNEYLNVAQIPFAF